MGVRTPARNSFKIKLWQKVSKRNMKKRNLGMSQKLAAPTNNCRVFQGTLGNDRLPNFTTQISKNESFSPFLVFLTEVSPSTEQ